MEPSDLLAKVLSHVVSNYYLLVSIEGADITMWCHK